MTEMAISNPSCFDEDLFLKNIREVLEDKSELVLKLLLVLIVEREDLCKK